jgi:serine/threonine-protein kinase
MQNSRKVFASSLERLPSRDKTRTSVNSSQSEYAIFQYAPQTLAPEAITEEPQSETLIESELHAVLVSSIFSRTPRLRRLLEYLVQRSLEANPTAPKEYSIGIDVFDRDALFDPRIDPIVRVEASRLRSRLSTYYLTEGAERELRIEVPKGGYGPIIRSVGHSGDCNKGIASVTTPTTIAVLPFVKIGISRKHHSSIDELTSRLIHLLTLRSCLLVVPRMSSSQVPPTMNARQLGEYLGTATLVEGTAIPTDDDKWQFLVCLVDSLHGFNIWSGSYSGISTSIDSLAAQIADDIISAFQRQDSHELTSLSSNDKS